MTTLLQQEGHTGSAAEVNETTGRRLRVIRSVRFLWWLLIKFLFLTSWSLMLAWGKYVVPVCPLGSGGRLRKGAK